MQTSTAAVCWFLLTLGGGAAVAISQVAPSPPSIWDGVFSEAQVRRGKQAYQASCAACHGDNLVAVDPESPSLTGPRFKVAWVGKTIAEPFEVTRKTMPPTSPGSLDNQTNVDILAFVLEFNGYPTGPQELGVDLAVLKRIVIERPENRPQRFVGAVPSRRPGS